MNKTKNNLRRVKFKMFRNLFKSALSKTHNQKDLLSIDIQKHRV